MNVIFNRNDFRLCDVPVPKGYPQSQTHSGVVFRNGLYYLVTSPYPVKKIGKLLYYVRAAIYKLSLGKCFNRPNGEYFENPCIYQGEESSGAEPPTHFSLMHHHALMETPEAVYDFPSFNSDPDVYVENERLYILNRAVVRRGINNGNGYQSLLRLFLITGKDVNRHFLLEGTNVVWEDDRCLISPCLIKLSNKYYLFYLDTNSYNDGKTFKGLYYKQSEAIPSIFSDNALKSVVINANGLLPWHMSVFENNNRLYSIIACVREGEGHRCWQMLGEFNEDITELKIYKTPLTDYKSYRGGACVTDRGEFVLYSTTVNERIKGSKAIDGRDVIMAHKNFNELLKELRNNE